MATPMKTEDGNSKAVVMKAWKTVARVSTWILFFILIFFICFLSLFFSFLFFFKQIIIERRIVEDEEDEDQTTLGSNTNYDAEWNGIRVFSGKIWLRTRVWYKRKQPSGLIPGRTTHPFPEKPHLSEISKAKHVL